jgi:DnaJ-domain-containing protein 1
MTIVLIALLLAALLLAVALTLLLGRARRSPAAAEPKWRDESEIEHRSRRFSFEEQPGVTGFTRQVDESSVPLPVDSSEYRVRPGSGPPDDRWDPYAAEASRVERIRAARRRARPSRPFAPAGHGHGRSSVDPYEVLGVSPQASPPDIERAYKQLVARIHPDRFHNDPRGKAAAEKQLREVNAAISVLRDPEKRSRYDELR